MQKLQNNIKVQHKKPDRPVADFYCRYCSEGYELKSKRNSFEMKITAGAL